MVAPIIPGLTDREIERILEAAQRGRRPRGRLRAAAPAARDQGRCSANGWRPNSPTAPTASSTCCARCTAARDYASEFGVRQRGTGPYAEQIAHALPPGAEATRLQRATARSCAPTCSSVPCSPGQTNAAFLTVFLSAPRPGRFDFAAGAVRTCPAMGNAAAESRPRPTFELEAAELQLHGGPVAGVDEAGRGPLGRPGGRRRRHPRPRPHPRRHRRHQGARRGSARVPLSCASARRPIVGVGIADVDRIDRDNILHATCGRWRRPSRSCRRPPEARRSSTATARRDLDVSIAHHRQGRRQLPVDRRGVDRRQGDARPPDGGAGAPVSRLRLRAPQGLRHAPSITTAITRLGVTAQHRRSFRAGAAGARPDRRAQPECV